MVTLTVLLAVALLMWQTFDKISGVTSDGFSACEALKKSAVTSSNNSQYSIFSKGVVLLKIIGDSNLSQSCVLVFVLPTYAENFVRAESSFNLLTKHYWYKVVLILSIYSWIVSVTTDLSIDCGKYITTADEEITVSTTLSYSDTCSIMLSRGYVLTSPTSIGLENSRACGGGYTISPPASTSRSSFKSYVSE